MESPAGSLALANPMPPASWTARNFKPPRDFAANARTSAMPNTVISASVQPSEWLSRSIHPASAPQQLTHRNVTFIEISHLSNVSNVQNHARHRGRDGSRTRNAGHATASAQTETRSLCKTWIQRQDVCARVPRSSAVVSGESFFAPASGIPPNWHSPRTTCCALWNIGAWLRFTHWRSRMIITPGRANTAAPACVSGWLELQYRMGKLHLSAILLAIERSLLAREFRPRFVAAQEHRFAVGRHPICGVN
jgi:hypothetical protein